MREIYQQYAIAQDRQKERHAVGIYIRTVMVLKTKRATGQPQKSQSQS